MAGAAQMRGVLVRIAGVVAIVILGGCVARAPAQPAKLPVQAETRAPSPQAPPEQPPAEAAPTEPAPKADPLAAEVRLLIDDLVNIGIGAPGMSSTYNAYGFAPLPEIHYSTGAFVLGHEPSHVAESFRRLVEIGPDAIPYLLDSLDDSRPTGLVTGGGIIMWSNLSDEVDCNPAIEREAGIVKETGLEEGQVVNEDAYLVPDHRFEIFYRVLVGDVCFAALGQITNRPYSLSRYQPTGGLVINSPVHHPRIRNILRALWDVESPRELLHENLLLDLQSDLWVGLYAGAATHLLYYYGDQDGEAIAARLERETQAEYPRTVEFVQAVSFSACAEVTAACLEVMRTTSDLEVMQACMPVLLRAAPDTYAELLHNCITEIFESVKWEESFLRLDRQAMMEAAADSTHPAVQREMAALAGVARNARELFAGMRAGAALNPQATLARLRELLPGEESAPFGDGYILLLGAATHFPDAAPGLIETYLKDNVAIAGTNVAFVIAAVEVQGWQKILLPLLDRRDDAGYGMFEAKTGKKQYQLDYRVCDIAAHAAAQRLASLKFVVEGDYDSLDQQIVVIREELQE